MNINVLFVVVSTLAFAGIAMSTTEAASPARPAQPLGRSEKKEAKDSEKPSQPDGSTTSTPMKDHPMDPVLELATSRYNAFRRTLRDYVCTLVYREHVGGSLQEHTFLQMKVRRGRTGQGRSRQSRTITPFSVFLRFLGPDSVKGRKLLYVAGQNEDKILIRRGGDKRFSYVTLRVSLDSPAVKEASQTPIADLSLDRMFKQVVNRLEKHKKLDPSGKNTQVQFFDGAKINGRPCRRIQMIHPQHQEGLEFHRAEVYVDEKLETPARIEVYTWPDSMGDRPPLLAEYTFTNLRLNVGLTDADFHPRVLTAR